jgi:hypothetical protein
MWGGVVTLLVNSPPSNTVNALGNTAANGKIIFEAGRDLDIGLTEPGALTLNSVFVPLYPVTCFYW